MKAARLQFALEHKDWTLEDWKNVIWSDETSVILGHRRGGLRVWRTSGERYDKTVIQQRWKKYSEFMFWGCFTYDRKGPCHIWEPETAQEKKAAEEELTLLNKLREPEYRQRWELENGIQPMGLRNKPGRKPQWQWSKKTGKLVRDAKGGGIDWYRYGRVILMGKMLPFAQSANHFDLAPLFKKTRPLLTRMQRIETSTLCPMSYNFFGQGTLLT